MAIISALEAAPAVAEADGAAGYLPNPFGERRLVATVRAAGGTAHSGRR